MNSLTPRDMRLIEVTHAVVKALSFGLFAALVIAPFVDDGRLIAALIGD
jgi:uncharacterized protein (DUF2062 family)